MRDNARAGARWAGPRSMSGAHALQALLAVTGREIAGFTRHPVRLLAALAWPALWLLVFGAGVQQVFGGTFAEPWQRHVDYQVYMVPGLIGLVLLCSSMRSSLDMVYDREAGVMRLLLTAPLPRAWLLFCKLAAGTVLAVLQVSALLLACALFGIDLPWRGVLYALPAIVLGGFMLGALALWLAVGLKQLEKSAGNLNFAVLPMFFLSPALYPLWHFEGGGADWLYQLSRFNPFTWVVELVRFALYGRFNSLALAVVIVCLAVFFALAVRAYDPQTGVAVRRGAGA